MYRAIKGYKTLFAASIVGGLGAAQMLLPSVQNLIQPDTYGILTLGIGVVFAALRVVTTTPLGESRRDKP